MPDFLRLPIVLVQLVLVVVWTILCISLALLVRALGRRRLALGLMRRLWGRALPWILGVKVETRGVETLGLAPVAILASNHQSMLDVVALVVGLPVDLSFVVKRELAAIPFLGWYMKAVGMTILDRRRRLQGLAAIRQGASRAGGGRFVVIFPEGTRSRDETVGPFRPGAFVAALESGLPVIPVALDGPGRLLPSGTLRLRPGTLRLAVGRPIATTGLGTDDRRQLAEQVRREVMALRDALRSDL